MTCVVACILCVLAVCSPVIGLSVHRINTRYFTTTLNSNCKQLNIDYNIEMATTRISASVVILIYIGLTFCVPLGDKTSESEVLKSDKHDYAREINLLKQEINSLQLRVSKLENKICSTGNELIPSEKNYNTSGNPVVHLLNKRALRRPNREVAFQASLTEQSTAVKLNDAIIFNDVITNIGGVYKKHTGIFTAPLAGTYVFNTNIVSGKGHYVEAAIEVNGKATVSAISDHRTSPNSDYLDIWDQGNAVAVLKLWKGDKVRVAVQWPQGIHDIHGFGKSSFSGYLLRSQGHLTNRRFFAFG